MAAALCVAAGIGSMYLLTSRMQDMTNQNQSQTRPLPKLRDPRIVVKKGARLLELYDGGKLVKTYPIALGFTPEGDKEKQGDGKTPEGDFYIFVKNPQSKFHLGLGVSYPSKEDAVRGLADRLITRPQHDSIVKAIDTGKMPLQNTALGGEIYIHGGGVGRDWTWGCIALEDKDVEEIYNAIEVGTSITIGS